MPLFRISHYHYHRYPEIEAMNAQLARLRDEIAENTAADQSAIALIRGLVARVEELVANSTELAELRAGLEALTSDLSSSTDELAAAVAENTPAEQPDQPTDPVDPVDPVEGEGEQPAP